MIIEQILRDPPNALLHLERYVNCGSPSGFSCNTTSNETSPLGDVLAFDLPIIQFDNTVEVIDVGKKGYIDLPYNAIFCHPDNLKLPILQSISDNWKQIGMIKVSPTASGRTVKCIQDYSFYIKLDYYGLLGRIPRNLDRKKILSACEVSTCISDALVQGKMNSTFSFFQDDYGRYASLLNSDGTIYEMGFILRADVPYPQNKCVKAYIPFFSLFAMDKLSPNDETLVVQLYKRQKKSANEFCLTIILAVINAYFDTLIQCGFCLEAHAQNMLIGIDNNGYFATVVVRDMESVDKDIPLREYFGLKTKFESEPYKCLYTTDYNYTIMHSFMFDFKLGQYLLDPLLDAMQNVGNFNKTEIIEQIKKMVEERSKDLPTGYFPKQWYNYENEIFEKSARRPYIAHDKPRYRK